MLRENKRKISIPFCVQILAIFLIGVMASGVVLLVAPDPHPTVPKENAVKHTVTFAYPDGTVIEEKTVEEGKGVFPPVLELNGVFRGWSAGFNAVKADIEVHPVYYSIQEENLFYFDSVYVKEDSEFTLDLYIGGKVNLSSGTVTLSYDTDVLEYKGADSLENVDVDNKAGELTIRFSTDTPLKEQARLSQLTFYAKKKDAYSTQISLVARDPQVLVNGKVQPVVCATINNKIFFLQEVG